ncbi:MAG: hypothetical protein QNJ91_06030 [Gammaproteobacteria bacterium]|nr:hypothetical protein [Gammaproteobacteria bacterium]
MRNGLVLAVLLVFSGVVHAVPRVSDLVTGADMAGIEVTAVFADSSSETVTWVTTQPDAGAAFGTGWSLSQQGSTLGNVSGGSVLGLWTLDNVSAADIASLTINGLVAGIVFDILGLQNGDTNTYTPGSNVGRGFQSPLGPGVDALIAQYLDPVSLPDLWGTLVIDFTAAATVVAAGQQFVFLADTDRLPLPASWMLFAVGLALMRARRGGRAG